jgi:hypothetical protein
MGNDVIPEIEEATEPRSRGPVFRLLSSALIALLVLGVLGGLTAVFGWQRQPLFSFLGLLAGAAIAIATLGSARRRELTGLVLGAITLPMIAVYLGGVAATDPDIYAVYSNSLAPFLLHATGAALGCLWISRRWRRARRPADSADTSPAPEGSEP